MSKLNTLRFTVHTDDPSFKNKFLAFINTLNLINTSAEVKDYAYKLNLVDDFLAMYGQASAVEFIDIVKNEGKDFFYLHIDDNQYSLSFESIVELYEFPKLAGISGDIEGAYLVYEWIYAKSWIVTNKQRIMKDLIDFIREEGLFDQSVITSMSFMSNISSTSDSNILKQFIKDGNLSKDELQKNMYTGALDYYKAYIKRPQEIINIYITGKDEANIDIHALSEDKVSKILKDTVKSSFSQTNKLHVKKDAGGYYIHADESCLKVWNKPVKIFDNIYVEFKPVLVALRNFYGICNPMKQECIAKLHNSKKVVDKKVYGSLEKIEQAGIDNEFDDDAIYYQKTYEAIMRSKEKNAFILEINDWKITDEKLLQSNKQQVYTLGDDIENLLKHIDKIPKFPNIPPKISNDNIRESLKSLLS